MFYITLITWFSYQNSVIGRDRHLVNNFRYEVKKYQKGRMTTIERRSGAFHLTDRLTKVGQSRQALTWRNQLSPIFQSIFRVCRWIMAISTFQLVRNYVIKILIRLCSKVFIIFNFYKLSICGILNCTNKRLHDVISDQ